MGNATPEQLQSPSIVATNFTSDLKMAENMTVDMQREKMGVAESHNTGNTTSDELRAKERKAKSIAEEEQNFEWENVWLWLDIATRWLGMAVHIMK